VPLLPALGGGLPVVGLPSVGYVAEPYFYSGEAAAEATGFNWSWSVVLPWLYLAGVGFFAARTLVQWKGLWQWRSSGRSDRYDGYRVIRHRGIAGPFVAFGCIFLPDGMTDAELENTALIHEASHLRARHHYDTLLLTTGSLLLWFHPLFWMLRRLLATVHEYEADAAVIQRVPVRTYGLQLLHASLGPKGYPGLFSSPIEKRITMITDQTHGQKLRFLPLFSLCLLLAGLLLACSGLRGDIPAPEENNGPEDVPISPVEPLKKTLTEGLNSEESYQKGYEDGRAAAEEAYEKLIDEFAQTVYEKITYPAAARSAGETGKFDFLVSIDKAGRIVKATYSKDDDGKYPAGEVTVVGSGIPNEAKTGTSEILVEEVLQTLDGLQLPKPLMFMGVPMTSKLTVHFNFILKE